MEQIYYSFVPNSLGSRCVGFGEVIIFGLDHWWSNAYQSFTDATRRWRKVHKMEVKPGALLNVRLIRRKIESQI